MSVYPMEDRARLPGPKILTVDEAAEWLRIPKKTLYDWRSRGLLTGVAFRAGKHLRFDGARLLAHLRAGKLGRS